MVYKNKLYGFGECLTKGSVSVAAESKDWDTTHFNREGSSTPGHIGADLG